MAISEVKLMDCMEYMRMFPDKFFDLAIVDPPYGINDAFKATSRIAKYGQVVSVNDYKPSPDYFQELFRVSKDQIIWGYNHLSDMLPSCKEFIFWYKHQPVETYASGELAWTSFGKTAKCFDYPYFGTYNADKYRIHPTQKPIALYKWLIERYLRGGADYWTRTSGADHPGSLPISWGLIFTDARLILSISGKCRRDLTWNVKGLRCREESRLCNNPCSNKENTKKHINILTIKSHELQDNAKTCPTGETKTSDR